jgi:DNA-binding transcriptional regulator YiaG
MSLDTARTESGQWLSGWGQGVGRVARVVIVGGALGTASFDATSAVAAPKPLEREISHDWTNTGRLQRTTTDDGPASIDSSSAKLIGELRQISGLTWQHLARLFGVDRRAVHFWASGRPLSDNNAEHLARVLAFLRRIDRGDPAWMRQWLLAPSSNGELVLDLLASKRYQEVLAPIPPPMRMSRPPPISPEASAMRRPAHPVDLLREGETSRHPPERLLASKPIRTSRSE